MRALDVYSTTEDVATSVVHTANEQVAWGLGVFVREFAVPIALFAAGQLIADRVFLGLTPAEVAGQAQEVLEQHGRILTNPVTVALIREAASDADGFGAGFSGIPLGIADDLEARGSIGVPWSAANVVATANTIGLLKDSPVSVRKTSSFEYGAPPTTLLDRANSFPDPHADPNGEQIRIDRYVTPGQPDRFDVYIAGTVTFDPKTGTEPFDFGSDLTGVANGSPASYRAVESAMRQAGITPTSPVVLNGYSQGGLVASLLAASGKYNVKGVVTFGAPSAQAHIPASIPVLSVRNTEDLVPATAGYDTDPNAVVVQRAAFAHGGIPTDLAVPAHRPRVLPADRGGRRRVRQRRSTRGARSARLASEQAPSASTRPCGSRRAAGRPDSARCLAARRVCRRQQGRRMMPISQLMIASTSAPQKPAQKLSMARPKPARVDSHATSNSSRAFTISASRPRVRMYSGNATIRTRLPMTPLTIPNTSATSR